MYFQVHNDDCLNGMANLAANSIDAIVTDPPYGLTFMGKDWDRGVPGARYWEEALRVAKPGAHLLAFGGTRTYHRLVCAIEDAGWEIRDCLMWVYGSGFPKSLDVSKAIDKAAGAERTEVIGVKPGHEGFANRGNLSSVQSFKGTMGGEGGFSRPWMDDPQKVEAYHQQFAPATDAARQWQGWGTALKPAYEPIILARKPLDGTVTANVQEWGTGAINVDGCRVETTENLNGGTYSEGGKSAPMPGDTRTGAALGMFQPGAKPDRGYVQPTGRWPANLIHDGSDEVTGLFPQTTSTSQVRRNGAFKSVAKGAESARESFGFSDSGSAARFFYCAKASKADREAGNHHPTVKPTDLMRYLCRLITPPNGLILDPFTGSGSTGKAALLEGFRFLGFELEAEHAATAQARCEAVIAKMPLLEAV